MTTVLLRVAFLVPALGFCACALMGKGDALTPRYFNPDLSSAERPAAPSRRELRLGRITAAAHLRERIVFRDSSYELNFYESRRWSEPPDAYLRRALSAALFERHGLRRIISGSGPTLEVELTEFAELKRSPPVARVAATYVLFDNRLVRREASVTVDLPIVVGSAPGDPPEALVRTLSKALDQAVQRIVTQVIADMPEPTGTAAL
jgi:cholesterol transport system auxiliary component